MGKLISGWEAGFDLGGKRDPDIGAIEGGLGCLQKCSPVGLFRWMRRFLASVAVPNLSLLRDEPAGGMRVKEWELRRFISPARQACLVFRPNGVCYRSPGQRPGNNPPQNSKALKGRPNIVLPRS